MSTPERSAIDGNRLLPDLFRRGGVRIIEGQPLPNLSITSLTADSRDVKAGSCFVAVRGTEFDGHDFVSAAASGGASVAVVDREVPVPRGVVRVRVKDTREALARLAAAYYGLCGDTEPGLRLIGITGTNGKTTVAWLLRSILTVAGYPTALIGTIEYDLLGEHRPGALTTPGALELCRHLAIARKAGAAYGVLEVSSHALDQRRCDGLCFSAAVFTNLSGDHLDYHRSMESYAAAKRRLFDLLAHQGVCGQEETPCVAAVNGDDAMGRWLAKDLNVPVVSFGLEAQDLEVTARIEEMNGRGSRFVLCARTFDVPVRCSLIGRHNVQNALAAAAVAEAVGIGADAIREGIERVTCVPGRLQHVEPQGCPFSVLVDYAHTDAALANTLCAVRPLTAGRLICVFGCGGDRDRSKRPRMAAVVGEFADVAYVTSDNPRTEDPQAIIDEILPGFGKSPRCRVEVEVDRRRAIASAISETRPGDTVLIAGKGHETYQLIGDKVLSFDDVEVAGACMKASAANV